MAALIIMRVRPASSLSSARPDGGRLGFYCRQHPDANLIETSEQILGELDRVSKRDGTELLTRRAFRSRMLPRKAERVRHGWSDH